MGCRYSSGAHINLTLPWSSESQPKTLKRRLYTHDEPSCDANVVAVTAPVTLAYDFCMSNRLQRNSTVWSLLMGRNEAALSLRTGNARKVICQSGGEKLCALRIE